MSQEKQIFVTSPLLPDLNEFVNSLKEIWDAKWITNNGAFHQQLEESLCEYLKVPHICLFANGTLTMMLALHALRITGEVITTPYSFVATTHSIWWCGIKPVFVDVEEQTGNLNPAKIEAAITPKTTAIMPVHVYGNPCDTEAIQQIADKYGLKVIYDAAHAFGVERNGQSILTAGDISSLSFHATKIFSTAEGGALVCHDETTKKRIDFLKNFGFAGETEVVMPGINGKMDEIRAAFGLLNLKLVDDAIAKRRQIALTYRQHLNDVQGIRMIADMPDVKSNYAYFPIFVDEKMYGISRDELYDILKSHHMYGRRYFYPLISTFSPYRGLDSACPNNLPVATKLADSVICLPIYHDLKMNDVQRIIDTIKTAAK